MVFDDRLQKCMGESKSMEVHAPGAKIGVKVVGPSQQKPSHASFESHVYESRPAGKL